MMAESRRRPNLFSRLLRLPAANSVAHELDETLEEARAFLQSRDNTSRTNNVNSAADSEDTDEVNEPDLQDISFDFDFERLSQLPWARAASMVGPFAALYIIKSFL